MKTKYLKPSTEVHLLESMQVLATSGNPGGSGEDIPWGAPKMKKGFSNFS